MGDENDDRLRKVERDQAVHEAICAGRYQSINLRLNVLLMLMLALLGAAAAGNPVLTAIRGAFAGTP